MTNSVPQAVNPSILDVLSAPSVMWPILVVIVLLILWAAGPLKRLKNFSLKFFKTSALQMGFHKSDDPQKTNGGDQKVKAEKPAKNPEARRRQAPKKLTDVAGLRTKMGSTLQRRKKALKPLPPNFEERQIEAGFSKLNSGQVEQIVEAKKCFDSVLQQNPKSVDACFGLARVLEAWGDIPNAVKYYWEATRLGDGNHPRALEAQTRLDELSKLERHQNMMQMAIKSGPGASSFWFEHVPDGKTLARYFVALSNSEEGGNILIGIDKATRKHSGNGLDKWGQMLDAVRRHYVTAPCLFEVLYSETPRCVLVIIQRGLNRPYRVNDDDESKKIFVTDGAGDVREATAAEDEELRKKKRG